MSQVQDATDATEPAAAAQDITASAVARLQLTAEPGTLCISANQLGLARGPERSSQSPGPLLPPRHIPEESGILGTGTGARLMASTFGQMLNAGTATASDGAAKPCSPASFHTARRIAASSIEELIPPGTHVFAGRVVATCIYESKPVAWPAMQQSMRLPLLRGFSMQQASLARWLPSITASVGNLGGSFMAPRSGRNPPNCLLPASPTPPPPPFGPEFLLHETHNVQSEWHHEWKFPTMTWCSVLLAELGGGIGFSPCHIP